jgi:hypothetical protein
MAVVIVRGTMELREHELVSWCRAWPRCRRRAAKIPRQGDDHTWPSSADGPPASGCQGPIRSVAGRRVVG